MSSHLLTRPELMTDEAMRDLGKSRYQYPIGSEELRKRHEGRTKDVAAAHAAHTVWCCATPAEECFNDLTHLFNIRDLEARSWSNMVRANHDACENWARRYQELESLLVEARDTLEYLKRHDAATWTAADETVLERLNDSIRPDALSTADAEAEAENETVF